MVEPRAHVFRLFRRRAWNTLRAMRAMKMSPKMTEAATIMPITTLGRPPLDEELFPLSAFAWLESKPPDVAVIVVVCRLLGVATGGGVVASWAVEVEDVDLDVGVVLVRVFVNVGVESVASRVVVVDVRLVVVVSSSPPPKRLVNQPNGSSSVVTALCLATSLWSPPSRATRASNREG